MGRGYRGDGGDYYPGEADIESGEYKSINALDESIMVLAMETGTGIEFYRDCSFAELERHIATFNAIADKRAAAMRRKGK